VNTFDLVVLGAGSGGYACALRAAQLGLTVALVEKDKVGGTCLHRGCIPTKALLHAAEVADAARDGSQFGVHATVDKIDLAGVQSYAEGVVAKLYRGLTGLVQARGITVVSGAGRLVHDEDGPAVLVGEERYRGSAVVLASGSAPRLVPGIEVDGDVVLTSDDALRLGQLPSSALVLGGGVIGSEFASAWRSFGVDVTIVEALPRLVPQEEPALSSGLERAFRRRGITVLTGVAVEGCTRTEAGAAVRQGAGRSRCAHGLETAVPGVFAVGDLVAGLQLAHRGFAHGIFVAEEVAHRAGRSAQAPVLPLDRDLPRVTYSDPEVASVGLTEEAARAEHGEVDTLTYDLGGNGRSQILGTAGFVKLVRRRGGPVVGVHMIGARVGELIGEAQLITGWEAHPEEVAGLQHAHPTQHEALGEAHLALAGKPLHVHG
jgi:dihydrolipoamide dehydrogenase